MSIDVRMQPPWLSGRPKVLVEMPKDLPTDGSESHPSSDNDELIEENLVPTVATSAAEAAPATTTTTTTTSAVPKTSELQFFSHFPHHLNSNNHIVITLFALIKVKYFI